MLSADLPMHDMSAQTVFIHTDSYNLGWTWTLTIAVKVRMNYNPAGVYPVQTSPATKQTPPPAQEGTTCTLLDTQVT